MHSGNRFRIEPPAFASPHFGHRPTAAPWQAFVIRKNLPIIPGFEFSID